MGNLLGYGLDKPNRKVENVEGVLKQVDNLVAKYTDYSNKDFGETLLENLQNIKDEVEKPYHGCFGHSRAFFMQVSV